MSACARPLLADLSPAVRYLVTTDLDQLRDELPFIEGRGALHLLREAAEMTDSAARHALLQERIAQLRGREA